MAADEGGLSLDEGILIFYIILAYVGYTLFFIPWITGDGLSYYSHLRSLVVDGDLDFTNEFAVLSTWNQGIIKDKQVTTAVGRPGNRFSIGPAVLWSPFYLFAQLKYASILSDNPNAGYGPSSVWAVAFATLFYSFVGLIILDNLLEKMFTKSIAFYTTLLVWFSTPLLYYMYHEPSMAHGLSFFTTSLFVYCWYVLRGRKGWSKYAVLGASAGLMTLIRWQNAMFLLLPAYDLFRAYQQDKGSRDLLIKRSILLFVVAFIVFSPQILAWKAIYGKYLTVPQREGFFDLLHPKIFQFLFSTHGLLSWTPVYMLAFAGFYLLYKSDSELAKPIILVILVNILFNSILTDWYGDWAFGARRMLNTLPLFAIGLGVLFSRLAKHIPAHYIFIALTIFILWNVLLLTQVTYNHTLIAGNIPYTQLITAQPHAGEQLSQLIQHKLLS